MADPKEVTGVVLAGGLGRRAGGPKAALRLGDETLLERSVRRLSEWFPEVIASVRFPGDPAPASARTVADRPTGEGPAAALATALEECRTPYAFAVGCDMPDLDRDFVLFLVARAGRAAAVVPMADGAPEGLEPLHAVYRRDASAGLRAALASGARALCGVVAGLHPDRVPPGDYAHLPGAAASLRNLNTRVEIESRLRAGGTA